MEKWKAVIGWEGHYEVSDQGNVRSLTRVSTCGMGMRREYIGGPVKKLTAKNGYAVVNFTGGGKRQQQLVHRLVLMAFCGQPAAGQQAAHNNGQRTDNRLENLRWASVSANHADKKEHGTWQGGAANGNASLNEETVRAIRQSTMSAPKLAAIYGVEASTILRVKNREAWAHVQD